MFKTQPFNPQLYENRDSTRGVYLESFHVFSGHNFSKISKISNTVTYIFLYVQRYINANFDMILTYAIISIIPVSQKSSNGKKYSHSQYLSFDVKNNTILWLKQFPPKIKNLCSAVLYFILGLNSKLKFQVQKVFRN